MRKPRISHILMSRNIRQFLGVSRRALENDRAAMITNPVIGRSLNSGALHWVLRRLTVTQFDAGHLGQQAIEYEASVPPRKPGLQKFTRVGGPFDNAFIGADDGSTSFCSIEDGCRYWDILNVENDTFQFGIFLPTL